MTLQHPSIQFPRPTQGLPGATITSGTWREPNLPTFRLSPFEKPQHRGGEVGLGVAKGPHEHEAQSWGRRPRDKRNRVP